MTDQQTVRQILRQQGLSIAASDNVATLIVDALTPRWPDCVRCGHPSADHEEEASPVALCSRCDCAAYTDDHDDLTDEEVQS